MSVSESTETSDSLGIRPRLRHDVVFAESVDGAFVRHASDGFVVKGKSAYRWISALSPYLDGSRTVAELCEGLPDEQRTTVAHLISLLHGRGFLRDRVTEPDRGVDVAVRARFAQQIAYVEHHADDPVARFQAFRDTDVVLAGAGPVQRSVGLALLRNGLRTLTVDPSAADLHAELAAAAAQLCASGVSADVRLGGPGQLADVIVADATAVGAARVREIAAELTGETVLLPIVEIAGQAVLGPATARSATPCWTCALLRLDVNLEAADMAQLWRDVAGVGRRSGRRATAAAAPVAAMLGTTLAFDVFRLRTGCLPTESASAVLVVDLDTLASSRERVLPHPACPDCVRVGVSVGEARTSAPVASENVSTVRERHDHYWSLVDPHVGVLSGFSDEGLKQSPLKSARVRWGGHPARLLSAFDITNTLAARNRAVQTAAVVHADAMGRHRTATRTATLDQARAFGAVAVPEELLTWTGTPVEPEEPLGWREARSLHDGTSWWVPEVAVCAGVDPVALCEPAGAGAGAGLSVDEAVAAGLCSAMGHRALRAAVHGAAVFEADPVDLATDRDTALLLRLAGELGHAVRVLLTEGDLGHAAVALVDDPSAADTIHAVAAGDDPRAAARAALLDLVGLLQGDATAVDLGEPLMAEFEPGALRVRPRSADLDRAPVVDAPRRAAEVGIRVLVVDTTPTDLAPVLRTVRVVLQIDPAQ